MMVQKQKTEEFSMKDMQRIFKIVGVFLALAAAVMLVVRYWEKLTELCPCGRRPSDDDGDDWAKEAMDYADVD